MFEFSYHDQMEMCLWLIFWFVFVCRFCGMRTVQVNNGERNDNEIPTSVSITEPVVDVLRPIRDAYHNVTPVVAYSGLSQADTGNTSVDIDADSVEEFYVDEYDYEAVFVSLMEHTVRELKAMCKERTGTNRAIVGYGKLTKRQLAMALAHQ